MRLRLLEPWRSWLLWLSLGANLFAATWIATPHVWPRRPAVPPGFDRVVERMASDMKPEDAMTFHGAMARERPWYDMSRQQLDAARGEIARQIGRDPFDPVATHTAMNAMQDLLRESANRFDDSLLVALGAVSPDARARLSQGMSRHRPPAAPAGGPRP